MTNNSVSKYETYQSKEAQTIHWKSLPHNGNSHHGHITINQAQLVIENDSIISFNFTLNSKTITCDDIADEGYNQEHVSELKSKELFHSEKFPAIQIKSSNSTPIAKVENHVNYKINAEVQFKDVTKMCNGYLSLTKQKTSIYFKTEVVLSKEEFDLPYDITLIFDLALDKSS